MSHSTTGCFGVDENSLGTSRLFLPPTYAEITIRIQCVQLRFVDVSNARAKRPFCLGLLVYEGRVTRKTWRKDSIDMGINEAEE